jgi:Mrp family chromosome partitioning ATPase
LGSNLYVLPAGETVSNPISLLDSSMMSDVVRKAKEQYEIVFINCIDLNKFSDAVILSSIADGTVLIVNEGKVKRQVVRNALTPLVEKNANIIGVILNNRTYVIPKIIYNLT